MHLSKLCGFLLVCCDVFASSNSSLGHHLPKPNLYIVHNPRSWRQEGQACLALFLTLENVNRKYYATDELFSL